MTTKKHKTSHDYGGGYAGEALLAAAQRKKPKPRKAVGVKDKTEWVFNYKTGNFYFRKPASEKQPTKRARGAGKVGKVKTQKKYLVGYVGDRQCVYGPDAKDEVVLQSSTRYVSRMSLRDAVLRGRELTSLDGEMAIYELVPVWIGTPEMLRYAHAKHGIIVPIRPARGRKK